MTETAYSCQQIVESVTEYLDRGLAPTERLAFERHVVICPPCRGYLSQIRTVTRIGGRVRAETLSDSVREDLMDVFADWKQGRQS